jgi:hypothetical protein
MTIESGNAVMSGHVLKILIHGRQMSLIKVSLDEEQSGVQARS